MEGRIIGWIRLLPIAWRIPLVVALNGAVVLGLGLLAWQGQQMISHDLAALRQVQANARTLIEIDAQSSRLHSLIRQYLNAPTDPMMKEIGRRSEDLFLSLDDAAAPSDAAALDMVRLHDSAQRFLAGFQTLKHINAELAAAYETQVLQASSEISGLYAILNSAVRTRPGALLAPPLVKSHETFVDALIAINIFYFSADPVRARQAETALGQVIDTMPVLLGLAASDLQQDALKVLAERAATLQASVGRISGLFSRRQDVLNNEVDAQQQAMSETIERLIAQGRSQEERLRAQSARLLRTVALGGGGLALLLLAVGIWLSWTIGQSIRRPLLDLHAAMEAGARGQWSGDDDDGGGSDELAAMARTVSVFKRNTQEKERLEQERREFDAAQRAAQRRTLQELLLQMEAHDTLEAGAVPVAAAPESEAAEIAAVFNRVMAKFAETSAARNAAIRELTEAKEAAEAANNAKSAFLATMSHEIRTPMNGVIGLLEVLSHTGLTEQQAELIDTIRESGHSLLGIIDHVLDFSKIEAGRLELERVPLDLPRLVEGVTQSLAPAASKKGVRLRAFTDPAIPAQVMGDPLRLRQILFNLIGNAVKFTSQGRVLVYAQSLGKRDGRDWLRLAVADTGPGIDAQTRARLFAPFSQGESSTTRRFGGTGLGLTITRRLTELMGGQIALHSKPGLGSTFLVDLLLDAASAPPPDPAVPDLMGVRLLVVAPASDERTFIARHLEQAGAAVVRVGSAEGAIAASRTASNTLSAFDMAVVAVEAMTALELAALESTPLLFVGGVGADSRAEHERLANCVGFLGRPLQAAQILEAAARISRPVRPIREAAPPAEPLAPHPALAAAPILVAEDHPVNQQVIKRQLALLGLACDMVPDGAAALTAWRQGDYAAVITDCHMPLMDGFQLTAAIRAEEAGSGRRTPILALTANALSGEAERCLKAGMDQYLSKPVELPQLRVVLDRLLSAPRVEIATESAESDSKNQT